VECLVLKVADQPGQLPVEGLAVVQGQELPAHHQQHQHREGPVQERAGLVAELLDDRDGHSQRERPVKE
jgi:hypothetical protein